MNFYPKKISTIEELKLEKKRLLAESKKTDIKHLLSFEDLFEKQEASKEKKENENEGSFIQKLLAESSLADTALEYAAPLLQKAGLKIGATGKKAGKKVLTIVAKELIGSYLKWKAVELSFKGISYLIKSRKKKKEEE